MPSLAIIFPSLSTTTPGGTLDTLTFFTNVSTEVQSQTYRLGLHHRVDLPLGLARLAPVMCFCNPLYIWQGVLAYLSCVASSCGTSKRTYRHASQHFIGSRQNSRSERLDAHRVNARRRRRAGSSRQDGQRVCPDDIATGAPRPTRGSRGRVRA